MVRGWAVKWQQGLSQRYPLGQGKQVNLTRYPPSADLPMTSCYPQKFYRDYYHPSNARFWFYGDDSGVCFLCSGLGIGRILGVSGCSKQFTCIFLLAGTFFLYNNSLFTCVQWRSACACWMLTFLSLRRGLWTPAWRPSRCSRWGKNQQQEQGRQMHELGPRAC